MPENDPEVHALLQEAKQSSETVQELAFDALRLYAEECGIVLQWQKTKGREEVILGGDPEEVRARTIQRIDQAREELKERLRNLLATAKEKNF